MIETTLSPRYEAASVEAKWYEAWEQAGLFQPSVSTKTDSVDTFTITIPPPNITGSLHMGHALCYPLQDLYGRFWRLRGKKVLVLPGQDHAGIATQSVVSKQLKSQNINPVILGREKFVEKVWEWREESGGTILNQLRSLGCAFDWSRSRFTLDEKYAEAVHKVFIDWFDRGLVYRGERVVNWDVVLDTSVSDIETERRTVNGKLYHIRYPYLDGSGSIVIATTRPETMLADVAVAVHPSDKRYEGQVGKMLKLPLVDREIPLIADVYPDPEFGTGAVKITPAHDPNDFEVGVRHTLPMPRIIDGKGKITLDGPYQGMDRIAARKQIVADLEEAGFLEKIEDHIIPVLVSERSGEVVEPLLAEQWFAKQSELAKPAMEAVRTGNVKFHPERFNRIFLDWMENIRDWNISRKLWWGHRIPVYTTEGGEQVAALSWEDAEKKSGAKIVSQDDEVLDTWFSSGLWPFATLGWPEQTDDLKKFYPTSLLITDRNIINLWVARMMMMGIDLVGEVPFHDVFIYATVMTESGQRMSKSLGTGVDPASVIDTKGADALRFTLMSQAGENQEIRYSERRTEDARNFCNKIWNATRFVLMNLDGYDANSKPDLQEIDRWILSRLASVEKSVCAAYEGYDIQQAAQTLYTFFWSELCDWYIEVTKSRLTDPAHRAAPQHVLVLCLDAFVKMLHPIMPFITEEVFQHLPVTQRANFAMCSEWPTLSIEVDSVLEAKISRWMEITRALRALRAEVDLPAMKAVESYFFEGSLDGGETFVASQAWVENLLAGKPTDGAFLSASIEGVDLYLPVAGLIDSEKECERIKKEEAKVLAELNRIQGQLSNQMFLERAKPEVVETLRTQEAEAVLKIEKLSERKKQFGGG